MEFLINCFIEKDEDSEWDEQIEYQVEPHDVKLKYNNYYYYNH